MIEETIRSLIQRTYNNVYIGEAPIDVDECVVIRATSGSSKVHFTKETYDYPSYTIYVRSGNNKRSKELVDQVYHTLVNYTGFNFVILTDRLPRFVGRDEKNRALYSFKVEYQLGGY